MRNDDEHGAGPDPTPDPDRPAAARTRARGVLAVVLALLTAATCWAVAVLASAWLVPPYLLLMALILFAPTGRPRDVSGPAASTPANPLDPARRAEGHADPSTSPGSPPDSSGSATEADATSAPTPAPSKGRRGRGRARKSKPTPTEASWVQVGPGKFVRVEAPETASEAGPHDPVGVPAKVPAITPQPPSAEGEGYTCPDPADQPAIASEPDNLATDPGYEPAEDAGSAFDPVEARDDAPAGLASPEPPSAIIGEDDSLPGPECEWDDVPAVDGIAPHAEDAFPDASEPDWAEPSAEEESGRDRDDWMDEEPEEAVSSLVECILRHFPRQAEPDREHESVDKAATPVPPSDLAADASEPWRVDATEDAEAFDERSSEDPRRYAAPEPPAPAIADVAANGFVPSREASESSRDGFAPSLDGFVSSQDRTGPSLDGFVPSREDDDPSSVPDFASVADDLDPSAADFAGDQPEPGAVPDASAGSFWRISRLAPRSRTRGELGRPAIGNATPSRRHDRSRRPDARRPLESRPPSRRGLGRSRQITRSTPPRSPPRRGRSVGG